MLCVGFSFLLTTLRSYGVLKKELSQPYVLPGTIPWEFADLNYFRKLPSVEAVTPVISFDTTLTAGEGTLSGTVTAVAAEYPELTFSQGNIFPNESNMPFLVVNRYAAENFLVGNSTREALAVNDGITMTIDGEERAAILCGIFEDGQEQPVICMSYTLASRAFPRTNGIDLLFRLKKAEDLEAAAKALRRQRVSLHYDESIPQGWRLTKQQMYQGFLSALVLLLCAAVQMGVQHRREKGEALPERQALALSGLEEKNIRWILPLRAVFAFLSCGLLATALAGVWNVLFS